MNEDYTILSVAVIMVSVLGLRLRAKFQDPNYKHVQTVRKIGKVVVIVFLFLAFFAIWIAFTGK